MVVHLPSKQDVDGSNPFARSKNVPNLWPSSLTIRTRAIVQKSIRVRKLIRVYPLTLIRSRKGNWSHGGSTPSTRTISRRRNTPAF